MYFSRRLTIPSLLLVAIISTMFLNSVDVYAQANVEKYGQNRIQHRTFKWKYFETNHFRIYHYDRSGVELARYVAEQVENDIAVIESKIGGQFPGRFNIVLYNTYDEYQQTNIGRKYDSQLQDVPAGTVNIVGDKLVVYYTGEHKDLRRQTRSGMARIVMERLLFGENLREVVRNAILMNLPEWTINGFIAYIVDGWDTESNSDWKNLIESYPDKGFYKLAEVNPELAGKAFWKYVSDRYGEGSMKNLVYTTQLKSSLNQSVKMTLGMKVKQAYDSAIVFYKDIYAKDELNQAIPDSSTALIEIDVPKDGTIIKDIRVSPKGQDVAYVAWKNGEYKVYIQKTIKTKVRSTVMEGGKLDFGATPDPNYPIITWSNTGYKLAILYRKDNSTHLRIYNAIKAQIENYEIPANRFDRVLSMTFMEDDDRLIFSAIKKSKTDLYEFTIRGKRMKNITDDAWDDLQPWYVSGGSRRGILFISNRPKPNLDVPLGVNELPTGPMNVYFYNTTTRKKELLQMTYVTKGEVTQPIQYGTDNYAYLYNENGIYNQYIIMVTHDVNKNDSTYTVAVTNHARNIVAHQYSPVSNQVADVLQVGDKYKIYYKPLQIPKKGAKGVELTPTLLKQSETSKKRSVIKDDASAKTEDEAVKEPVLKRGNAFQTQFDDEEPGDDAATRKPKMTRKEQRLAKEDEEEGVDSTYLNMRAQRYRADFKPDFLSVKLDNSVLFNRYQPAGQNANQFANPSLGGMLTASLNDLMEDYRFTGGLRLPVNFSGTTYFLQFENNKKRVDWSLLYLRQNKIRNYVVPYIDTVNNAEYENEQLGKNSTDLVQATVSYPLNKFESIRLHMGFRRDVLNYKAQDTLSLSYPFPDRQKFWITSKAEYVFDNTINPVINIYRGFRFKFFAEYMYRINGSGGGFYNFGTDFRHYTKIYKNLTWAVRFAAAHSGGNQKILYFVGGVDNWAWPKYNSETPIRPGEQYAFQALATNMRGYEQNSWNGNSYGVLNNEFRFPVLATILQRPIQSSLLRNLQLVTFADVGSAWYGLWPKESTVRNDKVIPQPGTIGYNNSLVIVSIDDSKKVFGLGYGFGLRTMLFGYFGRADLAWNTDNHRKKPLLHLSLGTDF
ncbi:MAG: hypothetical protein H6550_05870 [Chitinophagales bacterium]|nr:hypothetical protein [Chitinophagales bacterium]